MKMLETMIMDKKNNHPINITVTSDMEMVIEGSTNGFRDTIESIIYSDIEKNGTDFGENITLNIKYIGPQEVDIHIRNTDNNQVFNTISLTIHNECDIEKNNSKYEELAENNINFILNNTRRTKVFLDTDYRKYTKKEYINILQSIQKRISDVKSFNNYDVIHIIIPNKIIKDENEYVYLYINDQFNNNLEKIKLEGYKSVIDFSNDI